MPRQTPPAIFNPNPNARPKPKTAKGKASTSETLHVTANNAQSNEPKPMELASTSQTYGANLIYCECLPAPVVSGNKAIYCPSCGSEQKVIFQTKEYCRFCGKKRLSSVKRCPKKRFWNRCE